MKGWRTIAANAGVAGLTAIMQFGLGVNWLEVVGPSGSVAILAGLNIGLRMITTGPVGSR